MFFFCVALKCKSAQCVPKCTFREYPKFNGTSKKMLFWYSDNHWLSKRTMWDQTQASENYSLSKIASNKLQPNQKMFNNWDVYFHHHSGYLFEQIWVTSTHIILLLVPANFAKLLYALDLYFNASFKTILDNFLAIIIDNEYNAHDKYQKQWFVECQLRDKHMDLRRYKTKVKLSETKKLS